MSNRETTPPADAPIYVRRVRNAWCCPKPIREAKMTAEQIKLLAQMLKNGQAKLVEQKDGKLVPVSLI